MKNLADKALSFARDAHSGQTRKFPDAEGNPVPYITHPIRVATIVAVYMPLGMADRDEAIAAAYMHDTIEDCKATEKSITEATGSPKAASFVKLLTDAPKGSAKRSVRKGDTVKRMETAPLAVKMVKAADVIDNLTDDLEKTPVKFLKVYVSEKRALLAGIKAGVTDPVALRMFDDLESTVEAAEKTLSEKLLVKA